MAMSDRSVAGGSCALALGMAELQPCQLPVPWDWASTLTERVCWSRFPLAATQECLGWAEVEGEEENPDMKQKGQI